MTKKIKDLECEMDSALIKAFNLSMKIDKKYSNWSGIGWHYNEDLWELSRLCRESGYKQCLIDQLKEKLKK